MTERLTKFVLMLVVAPLFAVGLMVLACFMLLLPVVALVAPGVINLKGGDGE